MTETNSPALPTARQILKTNGFARPPAFVEGSLTRASVVLLSDEGRPAVLTAEAVARLIQAGEKLLRALAAEPGLFSSQLLVDAHHLAALALGLSAPDEPGGLFDAPVSARAFLDAAG